MQSNDPKLIPLTVDGQTLIVPTGCGWNELRKEPDIDEMPIGSFDSLWKELEIVAQYDELLISLDKMPFSYPRWWHGYVLLHTSTGIQRILFERVILGAGINLTFGNPRLPPGAIHIQPLRGCAF